ncbi:60S ribosomal protein L9-1 [Glycine soja]|uniref:60S ribosomal protein L9-1 n=1 Tax=Glycine soja TaxID=3848 RepID=A0A445I542_GLYSO|nr:60S ribosomal protein L9-1 [Glycine soja]
MFNYYVGGTIAEVLEGGTSIGNNSKSIEIRNFVDEKKVRKVEMLDGILVVRSEKALTNCLFVCLLQKCHVKNKGIRKFLDGIYVSKKGTILEE